MESPLSFLKKKYDLHNAPEAQAAAKRANVRVGNPEAVIQAYLDRLEKLVLDPKGEQRRKQMGDIENKERPRALAILRQKILNAYVRPNQQKMAEGAAQVEERAARQMGVDAHYGQEQLAERGEIAVKDLESSLDQWIAYLSDPNELYPVWFRYYAFRNILDLGEYDKDKQEFPKRSKGTFKLFPDIDRGALAYVEERIEASQDPSVLKRIQAAQKLNETPDADVLTAGKAKAFASLPFAKQYAEGMKQQGEITPELRAETRGRWVTYKKGSDPKSLWASLQNKGTAWCTKGYPTANLQLQGGDFHVYYTLDKQGQPAIPRIAIRMQGEKIAENPRGVFDAQQNLEPNMLPILDDKLKQFGSEADRFKKISMDMKRVTEIEHKTKKGQPLAREDLMTLYGINGPIIGFGYQPDPRIQELRRERDPKADAPVVLDCHPDQIAWNKEDINQNTRAYIGHLFKDIFKVLGHLEHLYTSFPEGRVTSQSLEIGGQTKQQLEKALTAQQIKVSPYAKQMLESKDFQTEKKAQPINLVRLKVRDLFNDEQQHTTDQIYKQAENFGLDLCPAEVGPHLRLS